MITHYDLFAGIGGFSLALDTVFYDHEIKHIFSEWEHFPTEVLKKHWPEGVFYGDIADLVADTKGKRTQRGDKQWGQPQLGQDDLIILTGGFPCQPFSQAGRRRGTSDDRYKWPEMLEVIRNVKPDWIIAENVRGLVTWNEGMVLEQVCADMENEGYEVQPLIIPAVAVNAPHRRDRVWILAHPIGKRFQRSGTKPELSEPAKGERQVARPYSDWKRDWREVALATCYDGVDDGLPREVGAVPYSAAKHRKEALKAYGNAIVPQVAMQILEAIKSSSNY